MASVNCQSFQELIAKVVFHGDLSYLPSEFYVGLATGFLPAKTDSLASLTEVVGPGYQRMQLGRTPVDWPGLFLSNGNWKAVSDTRRWEAVGGDWTAADFAFITDVASGTDGRLFAAATLDQPFLNLDGDTWDGTVEWVGSP
jgi:hypothetical protein